MGLSEKYFSGNISGASVTGNMTAASFSGRLNIPSGKSGSNYEELSNKPMINGVELLGDRSFSELGFPDIPDMTGYAKLSDIPSKLPADGGDADTVGGHTVKADVPENAVFTDTVPDLSGYAKITDIPSSLPANGGNADTVGGHTVKADVPEDAVFTDTVPDMSGYARLSDIPSKLPADGGNADTAENINGIIISNSLNIGSAEVGASVKRVCNANTVPKTAGFVYAGIWFKNTLDTAVTAAVKAYATAKSPVIQAGYGTGSLQGMYGSGSGREWYSNKTLDTSASAVKMTVPAGKTGYFAFNMTSADVYAVIEDAAVFTDRFI